MSNPSSPPDPLPLSEKLTPIKFYITPPEKDLEGKLLPTWKIGFSYEVNLKKWGFVVYAPGTWSQEQVVSYALEWQRMILSHMEKQ
jgi:hypothetical protein